MSQTSVNPPAPRLPVRMDIEFRRSYGRQAIKAELKNISLTGAFLKFNTGHFHKSDKITISFVVSGRRRNVQATVVWTNQEGCGLQFKPFNNRDIQIVDDLMYFVKATRDTRRAVIDDIFKKVS